MKKINGNEQKKIMMAILNYVDIICRKNNIKYSLIGGSLIGAIRHKGFIPWDDDIDIILDYYNYTKLLSALKKDNNELYEIYIPGEKDDYPTHITKLIDKRTLINEKGEYLDKIKDYGLFIDIFYFVNIPNNKFLQKKFYYKLKFLNNCCIRVKLNYNNPNFIKKTKRLFKNIFNRLVGYKNIIKWQKKHLIKYVNKNTNFVISDDPLYGIEKEILNSNLINEYIDSEFEGHKVMIFKNYDKILRKTFNDYMILPPKEKRRNHGIKAYWK